MSNHLRVLLVSCSIILIGIAVCSKSLHAEYDNLFQEELAFDVK
jgi:hypothetical protein